MNNTDTHILCEPYEIENYLDKNEIRVDTFIQKTIDIMESTINSNYNNLDSFENLDSELINSIMSIKIPSNVKIKKLNMYNTYSNTKELSLFIYILKEKTKKIFSLKNDSDIDEVKEYVEEFVDFINNIEDEYKSDKIFTDFGSITNFENIKSICDDSFFSPIKEWISSFPSTLLDIQLKTVSENNIIHTQKSYTVNESKENELDSLNLKRQILYLIYLLYNKIINNIIETKIFWNTFLDMVEPKNKNVLDEFMINTDEDELDIILKDINEFIDSESNEEDDELNDDFDTIDYLLGFEDDDNPMNTGARKGKNPFKVIGKFFATFPGKVNKIRKRFKLFRMRAKNHAFYMKYMGRIEGLYERYADEAPITENTMKGDPVMILKENGHEYISDVSNAFVDLQHELVNLSEKFASSSNPKEMLTMMKSFAGMYMSNTHKANSIPNNFITSLSFKLGEIILKGNKIYGYTTESIAENKKFPPSNHAIVSLFVDRPDEKPTDQRVSDIFKGPESFKLIASNEKEPVFDVSLICSNLLTKGIQSESYKHLKQYKTESTKKFKSTINDIVEKEADNSKNHKKLKRELQSQFNNCWKAIIKGYAFLVVKKSYISDLINSYFIMMTRIDNLCKIALTSLLHTETDHKDGSYNTGFKADKLDSHKNYKQKSADEEGRQTEGEKQRSAAEKAAERKAAYSEKKNAMLNHVNAIKKSMSMF